MSSNMLPRRGRDGGPGRVVDRGRDSKETKSGEVLAQ